MNDIHVYSEGICYASVCSALPKTEVKAFMQNWPCGTQHGWKLSEDDFSDGSPNPTSCGHEKRLHYLFEC